MHYKVSEHISRTDLEFRVMHLLFTTNSNPTISFKKMVAIDDVCPTESFF